MNEEILIVDDNADIRNLIKELITDSGYKTRVAANYNQALAEIDLQTQHLQKVQNNHSFQSFPGSSRLCHRHPRYPIDASRLTV